MRSKDQRGFNLIELMIIIFIIGILLIGSIISFGPFLRRSRLESYIQGLASAIKMARAAAMNDGERAVIVVVDAGENAQNLGDGRNSHYLAFLDANTNNQFDAGERVLDRGAWSEGGAATVIENTLPIAYPLAGTDARCFFFLPQGTAPGLGAVDRVVRINYAGYDPEYRLSVISLLGAVEVARLK